MSTYSHWLDRTSANVAKKIASSNFKQDISPGVLYFDGAASFSVEVRKIVSHKISLPTKEVN